MNKVVWIELNWKTLDDTFPRDCHSAYFPQGKPGTPKSRYSVNQPISKTQAKEEKPEYLTWKKRLHQRFADEQTDPKHTRDEQNAFKLDETGQNVQIFEGSPLFQATYNIKTEENKQLIQLILCQLDARRLAEGKGHKSDCWADSKQKVKCTHQWIFDTPTNLPNSKHGGYWRSAYVTRDATPVNS